MELLDRIHAENQAGSAAGHAEGCRTLNVGAIEQPSRLVHARAGHRNTSPEPFCPYGIRLAGQVNAGLHQGQLGEVPSVERKFRDALFLYQAGHRTTGGIHDWSLTGDRDLLRDRSHFHGQVQFGFLPQGQSDSRAHQGVKARHRDGDLVGAGLQLWRGKAAARVRRHGSLNPGRRVPDDHLSCRQDAAGFIHDHSGESCCSGLGPTA